MECLRLLREEFRVKHFGFSGIHPGRFYTFQWPLPPWMHVIYRVALAAYIDTVLIYFVVLREEDKTTNPQHLPWMAFLTNWTYSLLAGYHSLHALVTIVHHISLCAHGRVACRQPDLQRHRLLFSELLNWAPEEFQPLSRESEQEGERRIPVPPVPWHLKLTSMLFSAVSTGAVVVTSVFYIFLLPQLKANPFSEENLQFHFLNTMFMILEHLTTALPVRLLHVLYPTLYLSIYVLFSVFYWIPDHDHTMYPNVLDWNTPGKTMGMLALVAFVFLPLIQCVFYCIYRAKCAILSRCYYGIRGD